jgi:hypothetical protein
VDRAKNIPFLRLRAKSNSQSQFARRFIIDQDCMFYAVAPHFRTDSYALISKLLRMRRYFTHSRLNYLVLRMNTGKREGAQKESENTFCRSPKYLHAFHFLSIVFDETKEALA